MVLQHAKKIQRGLYIEKNAISKNLSIENKLIEPLLIEFCKLVEKGSNELVHFTSDFIELKSDLSAGVKNPVYYDTDEKLISFFEKAGIPAFFILHISHHSHFSNFPITMGVLRNRIKERSYERIAKSRSTPPVRPQSHWISSRWRGTNRFIQLPLCKKNEWKIYFAY